MNQNSQKNLQAQTDALLQSILMVLPTLVNNVDSGAFGRIGDKIVDVFKTAGRIIDQRLETDANYAAGIGELARTARHRIEQLQRLDTAHERTLDCLDEREGQIGEAVMQLRDLLAMAGHPDTDLSETTRKAAIGALRGVLIALGVNLAEVPSSAVPPPDAVQGVAKCEAGHTWPCVWSVAAVGGVSDRIVFPPACPECGAEWDEIEDTSETPGAEPS